jgi:hypothetical protein
MHDRYYDLGEGLVIRVQQDGTELHVAERVMSANGDEELYLPIEEVPYGDFSCGGLGVK